MIDINQILTQIKNAQDVTNKILSGGTYDSVSLQKAILKSLSLIKYVHGESSTEYTMLSDLRTQYYNTHRQDAYKFVHRIHPYLVAVLSNLRDDINSGILKSIKEEVAGELFGDLITMAKKLMSNDNKDAAAVLACAALEDSMKKIARQNNIESEDADLSQVMNSLKAKSILKGTQAGVAKSFVTLRNKAFHAQFDKIESPEVHSLIAFTESFLIENYQ